ncbi:MAG: hypothetical protein ABI361_00535 [Nitrososphaera sp.]
MQKNPAVAAPSLFLLCESCRWCATFFDKTRASDRCLECKGSFLSSFPVMPDEAFIFSYSEKHGVELDFVPRKKRSS